MDFEGDVLLVETDDGADIVIENGQIVSSENAQTAVFLSLFGGNDEDADGREKESWWGNEIAGTALAERVQSGFLAEITGKAITSSMLQKSKAAAESDLQWLISEGFADSVEVEVKATDRNMLFVNVKALKNGGQVINQNFNVQTEGK